MNPIISEILQAERAKMAPYGWIITKDYIADAVPVDKMGKEFVAVQVVGPSRVSDEIMARLKAGEGRAFALYDDDNTLYYRGKIIGGEGFEPLDDYGMPNAGCTTIKYNGEAL